MTDLRASGRVAAALFLLVCGALGWLIYGEAQQPLEPPSAASEPPQAPTRNRTQDPTFAMAPLGSYAEVVSRPLFSPSRRPAVGAPTTDRPTAFTLIGIVITAADRHALVAHGNPPRTDRVSEGQSLDGWTVKSIEDNRVVLAQGDNEIEVKAADKPGPRPVSPLAPPSATSPLRPPLRGPIANPQAGALPGVGRE